MLLKQLMEMPEFIDRELKREEPEQRRISIDAFDREFDLLDRRQFTDDQRAVYGIRKDKSSAMAGEIRQDGDESYIAVMVHLDFHAQPQIGELKGNVIQVDTVIASPSMKSYGHGYNLYLACAIRGYTLVSDNVQYIGGKKLWDKIIRNGASDNVYVYILSEGKLLRDDNGPIRFNGSNISPDRIWGKPGSLQAHHTLLVMTGTAIK